MKKIRDYKARLKTYVRNRCDKLTFRQRYFLIATMIFIFFSLSITVLCSVIYQLGKQDKEKELHINSASYFIQDNYGK